MKILKRIGYSFLGLIGLVLIIGLVLAFLPTPIKSNHPNITPQQAAGLRKNFTDPHYELTTAEGDTLFMRRLDPSTIDSAKKDIAVLFFHGLTAHSGAGPYLTAGRIISNGGYTFFGLDYRGHGISGGNRADYKNKEQFQADLKQAVAHVKSLGFPRVVVMGHSLGVAAAMWVTMGIPNEISGLMLISGAYEGRKGLQKPIPFFEQARIISSSIFRPSKQAVSYYREGMTVTEDPLFNFQYTLRFFTMMDVKKLILPSDLNIPVLVAVGDKDELFEVEKVKDFYNMIPGDKKEFVVLENTTHAVFPDEAWQRLVVWLDETY